MAQQVSQIYFPVLQLSLSCETSTSATLLSLKTRSRLSSFHGQPRWEVLPCSHREPQINPTSAFPPSEVSRVHWWEWGVDRGWPSLVTPMLSLLGKKGSSPSSAWLWSKAAIDSHWKRSLLALFNCVLVKNKENLGRISIEWLPAPSQDR